MFFFLLISRDFMKFYWLRDPVWFLVKKACLSHWSFLYYLMAPKWAVLRDLKNSKVKKVFLIVAFAKQYMALCSSEVVIVDILVFWLSSILHLEDTRLSSIPSMALEVPHFLKEHATNVLGQIIPRLFHPFTDSGQRFSSHVTSSCEHLIPIYHPRDPFSLSQSFRGRGRGRWGAESAHTNFKDSYLRIEYCSRSDIW